MEWKQLMKKVFHDDKNKHAKRRTSLSPVWTFGSSWISMGLVFACLPDIPKACACNWSCWKRPVTVWFLSRMVWKTYSSSKLVWAESKMDYLRAGVGDAGGSTHSTYGFGGDIVYFHFTRRRLRGETTFAFLLDSIELMHSNLRRCYISFERKGNNVRFLRWCQPFSNISLRFLTIIVYWSKKKPQLVMKCSLFRCLKLQKLLDARRMQSLSVSADLNSTPQHTWWLFVIWSCGRYICILETKRSTASVNHPVI